jgi:predicted PurR-regulated permease PerM
MQTPWVKGLILLASLALAAVIIYHLRVVLMPFFVALALAYVLDPAVDALQRLRLPRSGAIVVLLLGVLGVLSALALAIYPMLRQEAEALAHELPRYIATLQQWLTPLINRVAQIDPDTIQEIFQRLEGLPLQILSSLSQVLAGTLASLQGLFTIILNLVVIPVATFYFLRDIDHMRTAFPRFLPLSYHDWIMAKLGEIDTSLAGFVRGQLLAALILAVLYAMGLWLVGAPSGVLLGLLAGAASVIPFMGLVVGLVPSLLLSFLRFHDWQHFVGVVAVFVVVHLLEANVITPKVVGERLGLHPVVVLLALLVGGELFGFLGILLAVPAAAVIKVFWRDILAFYRAL